MVRCLTVSLENWGDGTGRLCGEVHSNGFSGVGCAAFDIENLKSRALAFLKFPLNLGETVDIAGGYLDKSDPHVLADEHFYIGVSPANQRGTLIMKVRLARPMDDVDLGGSRQSVSIEMPIEYQQLTKFANELLALADGKLTEVVFNPGEP